MSETPSSCAAAGRTVRGVYDDRFLRHDRPGHPERAERLRRVAAELRRRGLWERLSWLAAVPATEDELTSVHEPGYVALIREASAAGGGRLDPDTYVTGDSYEVACLAAGSALRLSESVARDGGAGLALLRPPGHHATAQRASGFCLFNNTALVAEHVLRRLGVERVAVVDWDLHHGNGTQDVFLHRRDALYCSVHESPKFPGTGGRDEVGVGEGEGHTVNVPLRAGAGDEHWLRAFDEVLAPIVRAYEPQFLVVSAGYDAHVADPLGGMAVSATGFRGMTDRVLAWADGLCGGRLALVLEGGYDLQGLADGVAASCEALLALPAEPAPPPQPVDSTLAAELDRQLEMAKTVQRRFWPV